MFFFLHTFPFFWQFPESGLPQMHVTTHSNEIINIPSAKLLLQVTSPVKAALFLGFMP